MKKNSFFAKLDLTPDQYKRSNHIVALTMCLVYVIFAAVSLVTTNKFAAFPVWGYVVLYAVSILATNLYVWKHSDSPKAMRFLIFDFAFCYMFLLFTHDAHVCLLAFPVLMTFIVYLNVKTVLASSAFVGIVIILEGLRVVYTTMDSEDLLVIGIATLANVIFLYGGMRVTRMLITYFREDMEEIEEKAEQQKKVAQEVERSVGKCNDDFKEILDNLETISNYINDTNSAIVDIASGSESTASAANEQANMTGEIQQRLENTSATSQTASATAIELNRIIEQGRNQSNELREQSVIVDETTEEIAATVTQLVDEVGKVSDITSTIISISDQTNLLALNASIEAARAGEAGKGFAVVADEIRKLAEETKQSTAMITEIIDELVTVTSHTQEGIKRSVDSIQQQREKVQEVNESFESIENGVEELVGGVNVISTEFEAVLDANSSIVDGINTLSAVSQEISSYTSTSREEMSELVAIVDEFTKMIVHMSHRLETLRQMATVEG